MSTVTATDTDTVPIGEAHHTHPPHHLHTRTLTLLDILKNSLKSIGVVYGDIGTSPLYAMTACFFSDETKNIILEPTIANVLGVVSLFIWSLTLGITLKYCTFIMRADNQGEGGILALLAKLLEKSKENPIAFVSILTTLGLFGTTLILGDGAITPAISVLSAIEGMEKITEALRPAVVPTTIIILLGLFWIQKRGTDKISILFAPVMIVWFTTLIVIAIPWIARHPEILKAVHPKYALFFFLNNPIRSCIVTLGSVVLCITGGEALYADMGHFGKNPIRLAWGFPVMPALLINYLGQGALLLEKHDPDTVSSIFYSLAPSHSWLYFLVPLAALSTIIASQALITGSFSLFRQAIQLGYYFFVRIIHTSEENSGQIYVPRVNSWLRNACIGIVIWARSSLRLAGAYGIAVTGTMAATSILACAVGYYVWEWRKWKVLPVLATLLMFDLVFFSANLLKFFQGGYVPLGIAIGLFLLMDTYKKGREKLEKRLHRDTITLEQLVATAKTQDDKGKRVPGTLILLNSRPFKVSAAWQHLCATFAGLLHARLVQITIENVEIPRFKGKRVEIFELGNGIYQVIARFGTMESPNIATIFRACRAQNLCLKEHDPALRFFLGKETLIPKHHTNNKNERHRLSLWRKKLFVWMKGKAEPAAAHFGIPANKVLEGGAQIEL